MANRFLEMRPKELLIILLTVFGFSQSQKGNAQEYYDLYTDNVFHRDIQREAVTDPTSAGYLAVKTINYNSLIGHRASPTPVRVPTVYVITLVSVIAVVLILIVLWLIHLVRKRRRALLREEFTMTSEDAHLSSMALADDPYKRNGSFQSFSVPMPDTPRLTPQISLTSSAGMTTSLYP